MSRLTGNDAKSLMEAYSAVYAPQEEVELTEEQVWEEVETWVNSLLEEGYDLSEYTWEEMYESYISEAPQGDIGARVGRGLMGALRDLPSGLQGQLTGKDNAALQRQRQRGQNLGTLLKTGKVPNQTTPTAKPSSGDYKSRFAGNRDTAFARAQNIKGSPVVGPGPTPAPSNTTSASSARTPSTPTAAKVASTKPTLGPTGKPLVGGIERRTPTRAEMGAAKAYRTPAATTGTLGAATAAAASTPAAFGSTSTAPKPAATPTATPTTPKPAAPKPNLQQSIRNRRLNMEMEYDAYDLVLEYLLSEGHADTVEEAHYVMMVMDAEMIGDIVEQQGFRSDGRYNVGGGRTVGPVSGAIRSLVTGNLPKSKTVIPPSKQTPVNRPSAIPASKGDSGKLTDFGAGGGKAKMKQGLTVGQVERQGRRNMGDYSN